MNKNTLSASHWKKNLLSAVFVVIAVLYLMPIFLVVTNSFKANNYVNMAPFAMPDEESFVGWANYIKGMTFGNYPFVKSVSYSLIITLLSSGLILVCTSMSACSLPVLATCSARSPIFCACFP